MGSAKRNRFSKLRQNVSPVDAVLASLALGIVVLFIVHFVVLRGVVSLVRPKSEGSARRPPDAASDRMLKALRAADTAGSFSRVVRAANTPGDRPATAHTGLPAAGPRPVQDTLAEFGTFINDPGRTIVAARVRHFFTPAPNPAERSLEFLFNAQVSPPGTPEFDALRADAFRLIGENPRLALSGIHRAAGNLDQTTEADLIREVIQEVARQLARNPEIEAPDERQLLLETESLVTPERPPGT